MITQLWREIKYANTINLPPINGTNQHKFRHSRGRAPIYIKYWTNSVVHIGSLTNSQGMRLGYVFYHLLAAVGIFPSS